MAVTFGRVLHTDPLITISKRARWLNQPMGFAPFIENLDRVGPSLHFVGLCFSVEDYDPADGRDPRLFDQAEWLARDHARAAREHPTARFVFLCNTEAEVFALSRLGVPCLPANELIFINENDWTIVPPAGAPRHSAVYNALFVPFKRHELAVQVEDLLLIFKMSLPRWCDHVSRLLPTATFANFDARGDWRLLSPAEIARLYAGCAAGLCLSSVEGAMRASLEYLLCGMPIVSTPSLGGRDRYFESGQAFVVEPTAGAVAEGVRHVATLNLSREAIRAAVMAKLVFDRRQFLRAANAVVLAELGLAPFDAIDPFLDVSIKAQPGDLLASLPPPVAAS